jgi:hypothetical protein
VNKVKRWRPTSETTAVDYITCFELVPPSLKFAGRLKEIYAGDRHFHI